MPGSLQQISKPVEPCWSCTSGVSASQHTPCLVAFDASHSAVCCLQLRECCAALLVRLLDKQVPKLQEGTQLLKALNVLMLKILDHANR